MIHHLKPMVADVERGHSSYADALAPLARPLYHPAHYGGTVLERSPRATHVAGNGVDVVCHHGAPA